MPSRLLGFLCCTCGLVERGEGFTFWLVTGRSRYRFKTCSVELHTLGTLTCTSGCHVAAVAVYNRANKYSWKSLLHSHLLSNRAMSFTVNSSNHMQKCIWQVLLAVSCRRACVHSNNVTVSIWKDICFTSPTALDRMWTIFSWGVATTLWLLISMMRWPTLTPPRSAMPPRMRLQICWRDGDQIFYMTNQASTEIAHEVSRIRTTVLPTMPFWTLKPSW